MKHSPCPTKWAVLTWNRIQQGASLKLAHWLLTTWPQRGGSCPDERARPSRPGGGSGRRYQSCVYIQPAGENRENVCVWINIRIFFFSLWTPRSRPPVWGSEESSSQHKSRRDRSWLHNQVYIIRNWTYNWMWPCLLNMQLSPNLR